MKATMNEGPGPATPPATKEALSVLREGSAAKLHRRLRGDLDNITLMALRKEPDRRYGSVQQFAEDLRRHLEGLPVLATKGSWRYRAGKFIKRHKVGMAASVLIAVAVLGGVGATIREARIAAANERRAERRFNDVRKLANSFLFEFHDAIQHLQGSTPARELVVKRALEYLDSLSEEAGSDVSLRRELATAYSKVGNVQGAPNRDNLGNYKGALESFQKAVAILQQIIQVSPQNQDLRSDLAQDYGEIGDILDETGDLKGALENYHKGLDVLALNQPPNMRAKMRTEILYDRYGNGLSESGDLGQAVENYQKALVVIDELIKEDPSDRDNVRDKAITNIHLADANMHMRHLPDALAAARTAAGLLQSLVVPENAQSRRDVGVANQRIADILEKMGDKRGALAIQQSTLAEDIASTQADPKNALLHRDLYVDTYKVAYLQSALGRTSLALANQRKSIALNEAEVAMDPSNPGPRKDLQTHYFRFAEMLQKAKKNGEALRYFEKAHAIAESLSKTNPKDLGIRADLAEIEMYRSDVELALGNAADALAGYRDALSTTEAIVATNPTNGEWRILLAQLHQKLGEYHALQAAKNLPPAQRALDRQEALGWYQRSLDIWKELQKQSALGSEYADKPAEVGRKIADCMAAASTHH